MLFVVKFLRYFKEATIQEVKKGVFVLEGVSKKEAIIWGISCHICETRVDLNDVLEEELSDGKGLVIIDETICKGCDEKLKLYKKYDDRYYFFKKIGLQIIL